MAGCLLWRGGAEGEGIYRSRVAKIRLQTQECSEDRDGRLEPKSVAKMKKAVSGWSMKLDDNKLGKWTIHKRTHIA